MRPNRSSVASTTRSLSPDRAVSDSRAPRSANTRAHSAPMPSEAPVMRTTLFSMCIA